MSSKQEEMSKSLMAKCKGLEACTDTCKNETDMDCINRCGSKYLRDLHGDFEQRLERYKKEFSRYK